MADELSSSNSFVAVGHSCFLVSPLSSRAEGNEHVDRRYVGLACSQCKASHHYTHTVPDTYATHDGA